MDVVNKPRVAPLSLAEFSQIAIALQTLVGAQVQDCVQTPSELGLAFYHEREMLWLWFDLHPQRPMIIRFHGKPPGRKSFTRPLLLFIRSRFLGRRLESVRADITQGRVLVFSFHRGLDEGLKTPVRSKCDCSRMAKTYSLATARSP